jgi:hypothetical protein
MDIVLRALVWAFVIIGIWAVAGVVCGLMVVWLVRFEERDGLDERDGQ